jgi:hypothetical protein
LRVNWNGKLAFALRSELALASVHARLEQFAPMLGRPARVRSESVERQVE